MGLWTVMCCLGCVGGFGCAWCELLVDFGNFGFWVVGLFVSACLSWFSFVCRLGGLFVFALIWFGD